jgi:hypothetical protein
MNTVMILRVPYEEGKFIKSDFQFLKADLFMEMVNLLFRRRERANYGFLA